MTDVVTRATRSRMMAGIKGHDTRPELAVRSHLHRAGLRFRLHAPDLPGRPDIVLPRWNSVIFVHGCYWHRHPDCPYAATPATNKAFWEAKFRENVARDARNMAAVGALGWRVMIVWECQTSSAALNTLVRKIRR